MLAVVSVFIICHIYNDDEDDDDDRHHLQIVRNYSFII